MSRLTDEQIGRGLEEKAQLEALDEQLWLRARDLSDITRYFPDKLEKPRGWIWKRCPQCNTRLYCETWSWGMLTYYGCSTCGYEYGTFAKMPWIKGKAPLFIDKE